MGKTWSLIQAGSRFLSDAEIHYAIIELELLTVSWAMNKCNLFLAGLPHFTIVTDHHPLIPILNNHRLDEIENPHRERLKTRIMGYNFTVEWIKGTLNNAPDTLSRNPFSHPQPHEIFTERDIDCLTVASTAEIRAITATESNVARLQDLRRIANEDPEYRKLKHYIHDGFPEHRY